MSEDRPRPGQTPLDRVLEELTAAPPPSDLRARVLARIGSSEVARSRRSLRWSVALPVAAAVAAGTWAAVGLGRRAPGPPTRPQGEPAVALAPRVPPVPVANDGEVSRPAVVPRVASGASRSARRGRVGPARAAVRVAAPAAVAAADDDPPVLPALAPPSPVGAAEITVAPIGEPDALEVPGLRVEPLSSPELNGSGLP